MITVFSYELRMLLCDECGAAIETGLEGGRETCGYCGAALIVPPRQDRTFRRHFDELMALSEAERLRELRAQDGRPLEPPSSVAHLLTNGVILPVDMAPAIEAFQRARAALLQGREDVAPVLFFLALGLYHSLACSRDHPRLRALLDTARDLLSDADHRDVIHALLAREAARAGDVDAAEAWIALCDPRSSNLRVDTAYRLSRAFIATRRNRFDEVLQVLGPHPDDIPIVDEHDALCALLRANAFERLHHLDAAVGELSRAFPEDVYPRNAGLLGSLYERLGGWAGRRVLLDLHNTYADLELCPRSLPLALDRGWEIASTAVRGAPLIFDPPLLMAGFAVMYAAAVAGATRKSLPLLSPGTDEHFRVIMVALVCGGLLGPIAYGLLVRGLAAIAGTIGRAKILRLRITRSKDLHIATALLQPVSAMPTPAVLVRASVSERESAALKVGAYVQTRGIPGFPSTLVMLSP